MSAVDSTGPRPAQVREEPRCPDCGSLDPCAHDESPDALFTAILALAAIALDLAVETIASSDPEPEHVAAEDDGLESATRTVRVLPWPLLASARRPVVIAGGQPIAATVEWLRAEGLSVEWGEVAKVGSDRAVQSLAKRVAHGSIAAIVFVQGFLQHKHSEALRKAANEARVPVAYAGTGGKAAMRAAFDKLEADARARRAA